jgi:hypothetical protein
MSSRENAQLKRILHSYHEAGHAVAWHVVGGLIEEVSIASSQTGFNAPPSPVGGIDTPTH